MIFKGAQRAGAKRLAVHLLNTDDNDFVEVHEVRGFVSYDVTGAFKEVQAIAKGTRCTQPFFSVSLNPPTDASVTIEAFEDAVRRIEEANGLTGQPRVVIFHEKDGRRHAHAVWSRIDAQSLTAKNLPHFKNRLQAISRDLFFEHQWRMPPGLRDRTQANPTTVTLAEWQAAKRRGRNAIDQRKLIQQCWAMSDSRAGFEAALSEYGYILARGDTRGHVIVVHDGEVLAVPRATGLRAKQVRERLGDPIELPSVDEAMVRHRGDVRAQLGRFAGEARGQLQSQRRDLDRRRSQLIARHRAERAMIDKGQAARWEKEAATRKARLRKGLAGLWQRVSGKFTRIAAQNEAEAFAALKRDRERRQRLIEAQLGERHELERQRIELRQQAMGLVRDLQQDRDDWLARLTNPKRSGPGRRTGRTLDTAIDQSPEPSP
ncbi:MAG: relaxase [Rhodobacter sp.]|nr:relaxase [Rhodobacter sp.]